MDAITAFNIVFTRRNAKYLEGEEIKGEVQVDLSQDVVVESLEIEFVGTAVVEWLNSEKSRTKTDATVMMGAMEEEKYLNQKLSLYARDNNNKEFLVPAGCHSYPFRIQLPYSLPSTFIADKGSIHYYARSKLVRPWHPTVRTEREFTVISVVDLSQLPQALRPLKCEMYKAHKLLCCAVGHISATWRLNRMGFMPGETIRINGEIHNNSRTKIRRSKASLIQHIRYYDGHGHILHQRKVIAKVQKGEVRPGDTDFWREQIPLPELTPSGLKYCNLINMTYTLQIKISPAGLMSTLDSSTDIIIASSSSGRHASPQEETLGTAGMSNPATGDFSLDTSYFI